MWGRMYAAILIESSIYILPRRMASSKIGLKTYQTMGGENLCFVPVKVTSLLPEYFMF